MRLRKLSDQQRAEIRAIVAARRALPTNRELAAKYGVCKQLVDQVTARKINVVNVTPSDSSPDTEVAQ